MNTNIIIIMNSKNRDFVFKQINKKNRFILETVFG